MFKSGLFYVIFVSVLVLILVGNRVTEGSGKFGSVVVKKLLEKLRKIFWGADPKLLISAIAAMVTFAVMVFDDLINWTVHYNYFRNGFQVAAIFIGTLVILFFVYTALWYLYYFVERLAEVFTYYWKKIWILDLTKKSRFIAIILMVAMAAGLVKSENFDKRLRFLGRHDRTMMWIRKIAEERRAWLKRRNENQEALREGRLRWDLYHQQ